MVIQKMSELGMSDSNLVMEQDEPLGMIVEQPLYANVNEEDSTNANFAAYSADRENNSIPVSLKLRICRDL